MKLFMRWFKLVPYTPPVPGRSGRSVWDEMVDEFDLPPEGSWLDHSRFDWAAA